jgi:23S rRNA pseudouridine2605 synthase
VGPPLLFSPQVPTVMPRTGLARALSTLCHCSRSQGALLIKTGRVSLNGRVCRDPERSVDLEQDRVSVGDIPVSGAAPVYLMLNKPRGLVTTASDEQGRGTVYECFAGESFSHLSPVGRLDKASEGLLLFSNDNRWANGITDPVSQMSKTYHVQVGCLVNEALLIRLSEGVMHEEEKLSLRAVTVLRQGDKNTWLEIVLDEGRNRHIRRVLEAHDIEVLRLVRVAIAKLKLGTLAKGAWRHLSAAEVAALRG